MLCILQLRLITVAICLAACAGAARDLVGLPGVWATVKYLIAVSPPDEKLVKRHARCCARCCRTYAVCGS